MTDELQKSLQESVDEWGNIEKSKAIQEKKDKKIISKYCAENDPADIYRTLKLLNKYEGLPQHDKIIVESFEAKYPNKLTTKIILDFEDVKDIYSKYLESGGNDNE